MPSRTSGSASTSTLANLAPHDFSSWVARSREPALRELRRALHIKDDVVFLDLLADLVLHVHFSVSIYNDVQLESALAFGGMLFRSQGTQRQGMDHRVAHVLPQRPIHQLVLLHEALAGKFRGYD